MEEQGTRLTIQEGADYLRIPKRTLERLIREGALPVYLITSRIRFLKRDDLDKFLQSRRMRATKKGDK